MVVVGGGGGGAIVLDLWHHVFTEGHNQAIHDRELKEEPEVGMRQLIIMDMLIVFKYSLFGIWDKNCLLAGRLKNDS